MKRYVLLIISACAFVFSFICFWFNDSLFNRFFIFGLLPLLVSVVALAAVIVTAIVLIIINRSRLVNCFSLLISLLAVVLIFVFPFRTARVNLELHLFENARLQVVEMVEDGRIIPDKLGNAALPMRYNHVSSDGNIYVYQNDEEQLISFWVFRGMLSGSVELIYSSKDISLIYANDSIYPITHIEELKEHWYLVETDY